MFEDAQSYGYARHPLCKNFTPSGIPKSHWELKVPGSEFLAVVSALGWVVEDNLQSIPKLLSLDHDFRRLRGNTSQPWLCSYSGWNKGKLHKSKRLNKGFPLMCIFAVCQGSK